MAKIRPGPLHPDAFPHHRGVLYTRDTRHGAVVQAWPTRRKKANDRQSVWWREVFKIAAEMAANPHPLDYGTAVEMVKGTEYVPRDWLMKCIYGNAYEVVLPDGTTMEVSPKGPPDDFMPLPNPETPPQETPEMAWEWSMWDAAGSSAANTAAFAFKGQIIVPQVQAKCKAVRYSFNHITNYRYRLILARMENASTLGEILASTEITATAIGRRITELPVDVILEKDVPYCIMAGCINQGPAYAFPVPFTPNNAWLWPVIVQRYARVASIDPQPGTVLDVNGVSSTPVGLLLEV